MTTPLKAGVMGLPYTLFGRGPGDLVGTYKWQFTILPMDPTTVSSLIDAADAQDVVVAANWAGSRSQWCDAVGTSLIFNQTKYQNRVKRFVAQSADNPGGCTPALAAKIADALTRKRLINFVVDEANISTFAGSFPNTTVNQMGLFHKTLWPNTLTMIRMAPDTLRSDNGGIPVGGFTGIDYGCSWYTNVRRSQTPAQFYQSQYDLARAADMDIGIFFGYNWLNTPDDRLWDHDIDPNTALKRIVGQGGSNPAPGTVLDGSATTNKIWLAPPPYLDEVLAAFVASPGYLDCPAFCIWTYPYEGFAQRDLWLPYYDRTDFRGKFNNLLAQFATRPSWNGWRTPKGSTITPPPPPPSQVLYGQATQSVRQTSQSTTYVDVALEINELPTVVNGHKYLIVAMAQSDYGNTAQNAYLRLVHGSTAFTGSEECWQPESTTKYHHYQYWTVWTGVAGETIKLQQKQEAGAFTQGVDTVVLFMLDLDSLPAGAYQYASESASVALTTTYADGASITFTPASLRGYLLAASCHVITPSTSNSVMVRLSAGGELTPEISMEGQDAVLDQNVVSLFKPMNLANASQTVKVQQKLSAGTGGTKDFTQVFALDLSVFLAYSFQYAAAELDYTSTTDFSTQAQTAQIGLSSGGDIWAIAGHTLVPQVIGTGMLSRLQYDNVDAPVPQTTDRHLGSSTVHDATDIYPVYHQGVVNANVAGNFTFDLDANFTSVAAGRGGSNRMVLAVQLATAGGGGNNAPAWDVEVGDKTINEGETISFTLQGNDIEDGTAGVTYSVVSGLPTGAQFSGATFTWTPDFTQAGVYPIVFRVTDTGGLSTDQTVNITVVDVPTAVDFKDLRNLRFDSRLEGSRIDLVCIFSGQGNADKKQGITGIEVELTDTGRI